MDDRAPFDGDTWEYQSLGVNLALGHGYQIGAAEDFASYKFDGSSHKLLYPFGAAPIRLGDYFNSGPRYSFFRTPGYPLFLSTVYSLFGVHPLYVKVIQVILLSISAGVFPLLGWHYWKTKGLLCGLFTAFGTVVFFSPDPTEILVEPLMASCLTLWAIVFSWWEQGMHSFRRAGLLGVTTGISLLVKGTTAVLPVLFLLYMLLKLRPSRDAILRGGIFVLGMVIMLLPWCLYASHKSGKPVCLSTEFDLILMDSNNEDSLKTGSWEPAWRKESRGDPRYTANLSQNAATPPILIILRFWVRHWSELPAFFIKKLYLAFGHPVVLMILVLMFLSHIRLRMKGEQPREEKLPVFPLLFFLNLILLTLLFYGLYHRFTRVFMPYFLFMAGYLPLTLVAEACKRWGIFRSESIHKI